MSACVVCGAPLDGESRFWCRAHYTVLGSFKMAVTSELMDQVRGSPRPVFRELLRDAIKRRAKTGHGDNAGYGMDGGHSRDLVAHIAALLPPRDEG